MSAAEDTVYHAKAPVKEGLQAATIGAGVGLLVSAVQNSIGTHSHGATGVVARTGGTIGVFGMESPPRESFPFVINLLCIISRTGQHWTLLVVH